MQPSETRDRTQVSAYISQDTKAQLDSYVRSHGIKKGYLIEEALQHHLHALREMPQDLIIPTRLRLSHDAVADLAEALNQEAQPSAALKDLFRD